MVRRIWILAFIDDPFDPPGEGRFGGGQRFIFDLGRSFVRRGFDVTYVTQLNDPSKPRFERLGPRCRIHRHEVGDARYRVGEAMGLEIEALAGRTVELALKCPMIEAVHAQYWVSGAVAVRLKAAGEPVGPFAALRENIEPGVLEACDHLVVGTPEERDLLRRHYEGIRDEQILLAALWSDSSIFSPRPDPPIITFVGRLDASQKGFDVFLDAIELAERACALPFSAWLIGGASHEVELVLADVVHRSTLAAMHTAGRLTLWPHPIC